MIRYLIKNNFKLMSRSFYNVLLLIIMPLVLIAVLSSAFESLLAKYDGDQQIKAGYSAEGDVSREIIDALVSVAEENSMSFTEYPLSDPANLIRENELSAYIVFGNDTYTVYRNSDEKEAAKAVEYMVGTFYDTAAAGALGVQEDASAVTVRQADYIEPVDSKDYYGIVEVIYFGWCAIVCGAALFMNEKKYRIRKKFIVSGLSESGMYFAKLVPIAMVAILGSIISAAASHILFKVNWGDKPLLSLVILTLSVTAASAFGLMIHNLFGENVVVTIIVVFVIVWFNGYFGGAFETYMFQEGVSLELHRLWPIYHTNRALVEISTTGQSLYTGSALIYNAALAAGCSLVAVISGMIRRKVKA
ncbi:MAG: ABC transporter permease [Lachnospiraceae bacterium]|nr:ABC transporter permease [Lachnospiraceae bacterium]